MNPILISALIIGIVGTTLVVIYGSWQIAVGVILILWADNLSKM